MQKLSRETKKAEAIRWMNILGVSPDIIRQFEEHDTVLVCAGSQGNYHALPDDLAEAIRSFEQKRDNLVYMVVRMDTAYGRLDSLLFVDNYDDEWDFVRDELKEGYVLTYTLNRDFPDCSDMGSIVVKRTESGGLVRLH